MHKIISSKTVDERYLKYRNYNQTSQVSDSDNKQCFDNGSQFYFSIVSRKYQRSYNMSELHKPVKEKKNKVIFYNTSDKKFQLYLNNFKI